MKQKNYDHQKEKKHFEMPWKEILLNQKYGFSFVFFMSCIMLPF